MINKTKVLSILKLPSTRNVIKCMKNAILFKTKST